MHVLYLCFTHYCKQGKHDLAEVIYEQSHGHVSLTHCQLNDFFSEVADTCVLLHCHIHCIKVFRVQFRDTALSTPIA
jgi:hypothetical protein